MTVMTFLRRGVRSIAILVPSVALWAGGVSAAVAAGHTIEHVGRVVSVDEKRDAITIDEMGPWHGSHTQQVRSAFDLTGNTKITMLDGAGGSGGSRAASAERPIPIVDIRPGDWANVTLQKDGNRLVVTNVAIVRPQPPAPARSQAPSPSHGAGK